MRDTRTPSAALWPKKKNFGAYVAGKPDNDTDGDSTTDDDDSEAERKEV
jgi:hypothetical protein